MYRWSSAQVHVCRLFTLHAQSAAYSCSCSRPSTTSTGSFRLRSQEGPRENQMHLDISNFETCSFSFMTQNISIFSVMMDNITQAELDALEGKRGPPDSLFFTGAGEYRASLLKPSMERDAKLRQTFQYSAPPGGSRPPTAGQTARDGPVRFDALDNAKDLREALAVAEATMTQQTDPVHVYDLKETAARKTQELIENDRLILHYKVYTTEDVENSQIERKRARVMEFFYRITDGTLHVYERPTSNSGLYQGDYAKKHIPFKPDGTGAYGPTDFTIGAEIWVSGRPFIIVDADERTRQLVQTRYGLPLDDPIAVPDSFVAPVGAPVGHHPHLNKVACDMGDMEDTVNGFYKKAPDTKGKFLEHGASMLRFECEWRETAEPFGDRRRFALQYFLADDTLEILDKSSAYARGGQFTKFISRQRLPRMPLEAGTEGVVPINAGRLMAANAIAPGARAKAQAAGIQLPDAAQVIAMSNQARSKYKYTSGPTIWGKTTSPITGQPIYRPTTADKSQPANGVGSNRTTGGTLPGGPATIGGFPVISSLVDRPDFITAADLICGGVISVYGRPMLIKSCDPYTVAFGLHRLSIDQRVGFVMDTATVNSERANVTPHLMPRGTVPLPPHSGVLALGSEEETRVNAGKIMPTFRAERDFNRFYQLQGKCMRFEARLDETQCDPDDARREFVVSFYLEDNTMAIVEVLRDRKGASAVRWLSRGKHRNFMGNHDPAVLAAVKGNLPSSSLPLDAQAAYDRVYSAPGDRFGYGDGFGGQGYSGGIYGKSDRVGAGGTGVAAVADIGIRDPMTHAYQAPPRYFQPSDFFVGARLVLAHAPNQTFVLGRPDGFTAQYLQARDEQQVDDARDVYVPDNTMPVPSLPLESTQTIGSATAGGIGDQMVTVIEGEAPISLAVNESCLVLAKLLAGVLASAQAVVKQSDKARRGYAPFDVVKQILARYGCAYPACDPVDVDTVVNAFVIGTGAEILGKEQAIENARSTKHASYRPKTPGGTGATFSSSGVSGGSPTRATMSASESSPVQSLDNPLHGPHLTDYFSHGYADVLLVDYNRMFRTIKAVAERQQVLQPRLDKLLSQLRMALLSSRQHLRRIFRDLDTTGKGIITFAEFRRMLLRHHLDIGLNDAQIRALMARFPPADTAAVAAAAKSTLGFNVNEPCISWNGFVEVILDAKTLAPGEVEHFLDFVRGIRDDAPDGVGGTRVWPELFPHVNQVSSWKPDMDMSAFGVQQMQSQGRPSTASSAVSRSAAPPPGGSAGMSRPSTAAAAPQQQYYSQQQPVRATLPASSASMRPATSAGTRTTTLPVGVAPELPISKPRSAPAGTVDPRPLPEHPVLDVVDALSHSEKGSQILQRMRDVFGTKRIELFRALSLYDTGRKHVLNVQAFVAAIISGGMKMSVIQQSEFTKELCRLAGGATGLVPPSTDVFVDYNSFLDTLYA